MKYCDGLSEFTAVKGAPSMECTSEDEHYNYYKVATRLQEY